MNISHILQSIQFIINVQHDCRAAGCSDTGSRMQHQERVDSGREITCIKHMLCEQYIINTHAIHNASRIRRYLPHYLTVPRPLIAERAKCHSEMAAGLRISQATKRAQTKAQAAATRLKNKERNQTGQPAAAMHVDHPGDGSGSGSRKRQHSEENNNFRMDTS